MMWFLGDIIKQEEFENLVKNNDFKEFINEELSGINEEIDDEDIEKIRNLTSELKDKYSKDEDIEKIRNLTSELKDKYSKKPSIEKKVDNIKIGFYQRFMQSFERDMDIDPGRLLGLTDGIFGMVMTLLVFGIALPEAQLLTSGDFSAFLQSIFHTVGVTIVSFILVSSFWIYHHEFIKINSLNMPYLWINILYLASISFIPFSTSLIGSYSQYFLAEVVFGINVFLTLVLFLLMYMYAYNRGFLENKPSKKENKYIFNTLIIIMALTVVVNLLDFNVSRKFIYLFLLVPVISTLRDIRYRMKS